MDMTAAEKALARAKIELMDRPGCEFLSALCLSLQHVITPQTATADTNGKRVRYNSEYLLKHDPEHQLGLVVHEITHVMLDHCGRVDGYDHQQYNIAADIVIDTWGRGLGFKIPDSMAKPEWEKFTTEQIYQLLDDNPQPPKSDGMAMDIVPASNDSTPAELISTRLELDDLLIQAMQMSQRAGKGIGNMPMEIQIYLQELTKPKINWKAFLPNFMTSMIRQGQDWSRPNRRYLPEFYLASKRSLALDHVAQANDISASVTEEEYASYVVEAKNLVISTRPNKLSFIQFDSTIKPVVELRTKEDFANLKHHGRGGTRIDPVMKWAVDNKPNVLIVFSDGDFRAPTIKPKCPVLWFIADNPDFTAPFGRVIHFTPG